MDGDRARKEHTSVHQFTLDMALKQYKKWFQQFNWKETIKYLARQKYYERPMISVPLTKENTGTEFMAMHEKEPFVTQANEYISKICREKYGIKCEYSSYSRATKVSLYF